MKHLLTFTKTYWAVILVAAIGFETYGCSDSASVSEDVAVPLSSLTITPGTLQPGFFKNTTSYTVKAPTGATTVTVTATPKDSTTTMTINGAVTASGQGRSVPLGVPGSTVTILIVLASQNGLETTYTVTVTRLLSSDNNLSALSMTSGTLAPSFTPDTLIYTANVQTNVTSVTVTATKSDKDATMVLSSSPHSVTAGPGVNPGQLVTPLGAPGTTTSVSIKVTAPDGNTKTYQITIKRLSGDANLSALSIPPHSLSPAFLPDTTNYSTNVAFNVASVTVSATKSDPNAVMQVHSVTVPAGTASGQDTITLNGAGLDTTVSVVVTAQNGVDSKGYTITVHRAAPSSNNNLDTLTVTPGSMNPAFAPSIVDYTVDVASNDTSVTVTATLQDANATMLINGQGTSSGQPREITPLQPPGENTLITIVVRAQNEVEKTYTITVRRPLPSSDNNLSALTVSQGTLNPTFTPAEVSYTVNVDNSVESVTITATKSDPNATMSALGSVIAAPGVPSGPVTIPVAPGINPPLLIDVIAPNNDLKTYIITVDRALP